MKKLLSVILALTCVSTFASIEKELEEIRSSFNLPGLIAASYLGNSKINITSVGVKKVGFKSLITSNDKIHIGSCAKSMTATLAAIIIESGKLDWTSTLKETFPTYKIHTDLQNVTLEELLAHRSGLRANTEDLYPIFSNKNLSDKENRENGLKKLLILKPKYGIKKDYHYSNMGYTLAGHMIEVATKKPFEDLLVRKLFKPLGMNSCGFGATSIKEEIEPTSIWGHSLKDKKQIPLHGDNPISTSPAGTTFCTVNDWFKFLAIHLDENEGAPILKAQSIKKLHTLYPKKNSDYTYGGWVRVKRNWAGGYALHHTGSNTLNYANVWMAPKLNKIFVGFTNTASGGNKPTDKVIGILIKK
jgi:CubicO group peptidase (beta-lactamase class C family)